MVLPLAVPLVGGGIAEALPLIVGGLLVLEDLMGSKKLGPEGFPAGLPLKGTPPPKPGTKPKTGVRRPRVLPASTEPEPLAPSIPFPEPPPSNNNSPFNYPDPGEPGKKTRLPIPHTPEVYRDPTGRDVPPDWRPEVIHTVFGGGRSGVYYRVVGTLAIEFENGQRIRGDFDSVRDHNYYLIGPIQRIDILVKSKSYDTNGGFPGIGVVGSQGTSSSFGPYIPGIFLGFNQEIESLQFIPANQPEHDGVPFPGFSKPGYGRPYSTAPVTAPPPPVTEPETLPNPVIPSPFLPPGWEPYQPFPIPARSPDPPEPEEDEDPDPDEDPPPPAPIEEPIPTAPSPDDPAPLPGTSNPSIPPSTEPFLPTVPSTPSPPDPAPKPEEPEVDPKPKPFPDPVPDIPPVPDTKPDPDIAPNPKKPIPYPQPHPDTNPETDDPPPQRYPIPDPIPNDNPKQEPFKHPDPVPEITPGQSPDPNKDREFDKPYKGDPVQPGWPGPGDGTDPGKIKQPDETWGIPPEIDFDRPPDHPSESDKGGGVGKFPPHIIPTFPPAVPDPFKGRESMPQDLFAPPPYLPSSSSQGSDDPCEESGDKCQQSMSQKLDKIKKKQDEQDEINWEKICQLSCIQDIQDKLDELLSRKPDTAQYQTAMLPVVKKLTDGGEQALVRLQIKPGSLNGEDEKRFADTAQYAIEGLYDPPYQIAIPESQEVKLSGNTPHLVLFYREKTAQDKWAQNGVMARFSIPHYTGPRAKPSLLGFNRGSFQGCLVLNDNSKVIVYASSRSEAQKVLDFAKTFVPADKLTNSITKFSEISKNFRNGNVLFFKAFYYLGLGDKPVWSIRHDGKISEGK